MIDDIIANKRVVIEHCLVRIAEEYQGDPKRLSLFTIQDSIVLNLQRACEASIDLAMHVVAMRRIGIPQDSRDAFTHLNKAGIIGDALAVRMKAMVGFRNVAVHNYQSLQIEIIQAIIERHLVDFAAFIDALQAMP